MRRALRETVIAGVTTTLPFHQHVLSDPEFEAGRYDTSYVDARWAARRADLDGTALTAAAMAAVVASRARSPRAPGSDGSAWVRIAREEGLR
jgi:acetyl/propionyl-CoA carboxylase alpha subunit